MHVIYLGEIFMELWIIWIIAGVVFFVIEIFTPILFFLNLAIAALITAIAAYFSIPLVWQAILWGILSGVAIYYLLGLFVPDFYSNVNISTLNPMVAFKEFFNESFCTVFAKGFDFSFGSFSKFFWYSSKVVEPMNFT